MKKIFVLVLFLITIIFAQTKIIDNKKEQTQKNKDCTPPSWAIIIGHEEMWLEHHDCPPIKKKNHR